MNYVSYQFTSRYGFFPSLTVLSWKKVLTKANLSSSELCLSWAELVQAKILLGTYRSDALKAKWSGEPEGCSLPGCDAPIGDTVHLLCGQCPALQSSLQLAASRGISNLSHYPVLKNVVTSVLSSDHFYLAQFLADPTCHPEIIKLRQQFGLFSIYPVMRFARSYIWAMHREFMKLKGQNIYLHWTKN